MLVEPVEAMAKLAAGDADIRSEEFLAQLCARKKRHLVGFHGAGVTLLHKKIVSRFDVHVHPRHDQMRRMVPVVQLHHVFAEVCFVDLDAIGEERIVAVDLFRDHALGFDDALGIFGMADIQQDPLRILGGVGEMYNIAVGRRFLNKLRQIIIEMAEDVVADLRHLRAIRFPALVSRHLRFAAGVEISLRRARGIAGKIVGQTGLDVVLHGRCIIK